MENLLLKQDLELKVLHCLILRFFATKAKFYIKVILHLPKTSANPLKWTFISYLIMRDKYSRVWNRRGGRNKRGGWQKSPKLINGEASKNTAIRNFIEIKLSNDFVKISTKRTRNTKVVHLHEESLPNLNLHMLINPLLIKKTRHQTV